VATIAWRSECPGLRPRLPRSRGQRGSCEQPRFPRQSCHSPAQVLPELFALGLVSRGAGGAVPAHVLRPPPAGRGDLDCAGVGHCSRPYAAMDQLPEGAEAARGRGAQAAGWPVITPPAPPGILHGWCASWGRAFRPVVARGRRQGPADRGPGPRHRCTRLLRRRLRWDDRPPRRSVRPPRRRDRSR